MPATLSWNWEGEAANGVSVTVPKAFTFTVKVREAVRGGVLPSATCTWRVLVLAALLTGGLQLNCPLELLMDAEAGALVSA